MLTEDGLPDKEVYMEELTNEDLIVHLENNTGVLTSEIKEAFKAVDRKDFVDEDYVIEAYNDYPLPIGYGQTISQPTVVAMMLDLLSPQKGDRILDVGCGSGWTTALLGFLVGTEGEVVGTDVIEEFVELARNRLSSYQDKVPNTAFFHVSEESAIYSQEYDKILVNASFSEIFDIPENIKKALKEGGRMVAPVGSDLMVFTKKNSELKEERCLPQTVSFVPCVKLKEF
ncbi:MAG: protein-L-isoaspartate O-methyltransferase family protein [Patescibacteria group bacterium]